MLIDFCSYNICGLNSKLAYVKDFLSCNKVKFLALLETHVKQESALAISSFVAPKFKWSFNYDYHRNGRIWLGWDSSIWNVVPLFTSIQQVTCFVTHIASNKSFCITAVYGLHTHMDRRPLWSELISLQSMIDSTYNNPSWCILGDFSAYLDPSESSGGRDSWTSSMREFKQCVLQLGITDLRATGQQFTWWDGNIGNPLVRKLDRILINDAWLTDFPL